MQPLVNLARTTPGFVASADSRWSNAIMRGWLWAPLVSLIAVFLCLPFVRTVYSLSDEGMLLLGATRMLRGERIYADFFEFLPPGGFVLTTAWLKLAGVSLLSARAMAILIIAGITCLTFLTCRRASGNAPLSAVLALGWVAMSQGMWTQVSHHWFTTLFSMAAIWAGLVNVSQPRATSRWPVIAGIAAGAAAMVTPTRGALAMLAAMVAFLNRRRQFIAYVLGSAFVPLALLGYVVSQHALGSAFNDIIRFTGTRYAAIQSVPFGSWANLQNFPLKALFPLAAMMTVFVGVRDWRGCLRDRMLTSCGAAALAGFIGCFPRPDMAHVSFAVPLAFPLVACCIARLWGTAPRYATAAMVLALCAPSDWQFSLLCQEALKAELVATPRGGAALITLDGAPEMLTRIAATPRLERYFFYPYSPLVPFLTAREDVARNDIFMPGYTTSAQYRDACVAVMRQATWVVIDRNWTNPIILQRVWPAMRDVRPPETAAFEAALDQGFELAAREDSFELLHRRAGVGDEVCAAITK